MASGIEFSMHKPSRKQVAGLGAALKKLGLVPAAAEIRSAENKDVRAAIEGLQRRAGLNVDGEVTVETLDVLNRHLAHAVFAASKGRTRRIHEMLARVGARIESTELAARRLGPATEKAIREFQHREGLSVDGLVTEEVFQRLANETLKVRLGAKTQVGLLHRKLLHVARVAKLDARLDRDEVRRKKVGETTTALIRAFQDKYKLPATGDLDVATMDRIDSVAASRRVRAKHLRVRAADDLVIITRNLRLNMKNEGVGLLQKSLAYLGYAIDEREFHDKAFAASTREAVVEFQKRNGLPLTGHVEGPTRERLNAEILGVNPAAARTIAGHRVRGTVRDDLWRGRSGIRVQLVEKTLGGPGTILAERRAGANGFFDVPYAPPTNAVDGQIKAAYQLTVRVLDADGRQLESRDLFNPTQIVWSNFTAGDQPYRGPSELESRLAAISPFVGDIAIADLQESSARRDITFVAQHAELSPGDVMRVALAHRAARHLGDTALSADVFYAFIRQNLPPTLPGDLLIATEGWTLIDELVERAVEGVVFMEPVLQAAAFDAATKSNLIPIATARARTRVLAALSARRRTFALERPILDGNGTLKSVLAASVVDPQVHATIAETFLVHRGLGPDFWRDLDARAAELGGAAAIADLRRTTQIGQVVKNHAPTLTFLKAVLGSAAHPSLRTVPDLAKLGHADWVALIQENGGAVPDGTDGATDAEKVDVYAATMAAQAERLFPAVAVTARLVPGGAHGLTELEGVRAFVEAHADLDFAGTNLDQLVKDGDLVVPTPVLRQAKAVQRVHRIAPSAATSAALLEEKIHQSAALVALGRRRFVDTMEARGIEPHDALTIFGRAELQYAKALALLTSFRAELYREHPAAIVPYTYTAEEQQQLLGGIPDLETLFGSLDACDCDHCQSLYGPAAYLADVLRFLDTHPSETAGKTVREILFERRPDLGNVKLSCDNTDVVLPYIDLVCEILGAAVPPTMVDTGFGYQTTGAAPELRAFPANVRKEAWDALRAAEVPMDVAFDQWQEDARIHLDHLGVSRHALMITFQKRTAGGTSTPTTASIAAESFGMSSLEAALVVSTTDANAPRQLALWGFDCTQASVPVRELLDRAHLAYAELLELVQVRWISDSPATGPLSIDRPAGSCDLTVQSVQNLTVERFDRIHRFLRLWRRTGWKMWELDLLVRAAAIGNGEISTDALVHLRQLRDVQRALALSVDAALALYQPIDAETRTRPDDPARIVPSLYASLFQNPALTSPIDPGLSAPYTANPILTAHRPALVAALAISEQDLDRLVARTDGAVTHDNLSRLYRAVVFARGLKLSIAQWLTLGDLLTTDPSTSPAATLDLVELLTRIRDSGLQISELDYVLAFRPDSPHGLRDEAIASHLEALTEALRGAAADELDGRIVGHVSSRFGIRDDQARVLLDELELGGGTLLEHLRGVATGSPTLVTDCYRLLHKATMLVSRQKIDDVDDLAWLLVEGPRFGLLDVAALPVSTAPGQPLLPSWIALTQWLAFRARYPVPEGVSLRQIFTDAAMRDGAGDPATPIADLLASIAALTTWSTADLATIAAGLGLRYEQAANDYVSIDTWWRLQACFDTLRRLGVAASTPFAWADRDADGDAQYEVAHQVRQATKSKYEYASWLSTATPLQDALRERRRDALIRYHVENSQRTEPPQVVVGGRSWANPRYFRDPDALLAYYLIDVEMGACQLTSRIKQAMSSVQMFVQRCFLNLEQPAVRVSEDERADTVSLDSWRQWRTMKSYRVWEANRKVFFYPENWIEPELRDDKSPFFKDLEDELLQSDLTTDQAETALRHYLEKVNEVARLEVVGVSLQRDDEDGGDDLAPGVNTLHVVGRTRAEPTLYYYRQLDLNYRRWTAWEKIDVDITGEHVVPVVYNRQLHLFWLTFLEKPQKVKKQPAAQPSATPTNAPDAPLVLELQLAWTQRKEGGWTAKKLSRQKLVNPWERPHASYHLKPRYKSRENLLWLDVYLSTSEPFNDKRFYDPYKGSFAHLTANRFDETGRPWHASSFIFDGQVVDVRMKALRGWYHLPAGDGTISDSLTLTTSVEYVRQTFGEGARWVNPLNGPYEIAPRLLLPDGMHFANNRLANNQVRRNAGRLAVLEQGASRAVLSSARPPFEVVAPLDNIQVDTTRWGVAPFVYQDPQRAFFVLPEVETVDLGYNRIAYRIRYEFSTFDHPYAALFLRELNRDGVTGLLNRRLQRFPDSYYPGNSFRFSSTYRPLAPHGSDDASERAIVDFDHRGAMSIYNWELFFHAPFLIACRLSENQRFEEAMDWFHRIFDPTNVEALEAPQRFWVTKPFFEQNDPAHRAQRIENLLRNLGADLDQVRAWKNDPFKPHLIARYRPVAYQKAVVMKYIDNLVAWGDQLFRRDTVESINEATTLYVLANELLGRRPERVPHVVREELSYNELIARGDLDPLGNDSVVAVFESHAGPAEDPVRSSLSDEPMPMLDALYFCIPANDKLLQCWDTVADRLFKIRHCMNIEGVVRQLPLFEPPIDPALLVKAAAAGVDLGSVLADTAIAAGPYKYRTLAARASELASEVRALGDKLRSVLEQHDAEGLALLRSSQEIALLEANRDIRKAQVAEAQANWDAVANQRTVTEARREYYGSRESVNLWEAAALALAGTTALMEMSIIAPGYAIAAGLRNIPTAETGASGFGGSPVVTVELPGGHQISGSLGEMLQSVQAVISSLDRVAGIATTTGAYVRRKEDWDFQADQATKEIAQIEKLLVAAEIRHALAVRERENLDLQIESSKAAHEFMRSKYTNQQLYSWMIQQLSTIYFQSYKLAYDLARKAEQALQFELGRPDLSFIQFGYWDSLKKGLLAADRLGVDLRRMDAAWLDQNRRQLEITKHISLAQVAPLALLQLKQRGECTITLPEWLFDMDYPGHYRRRLRAVSISIPCVVGPYAGVSCTLSLTGNGVRVSEAQVGGYGDPLTSSDDRFESLPVAQSSIATSHGREDTGMFELSFGDERYIPFEGAGAVSAWHLKMPRDSNAFDFETVSDIVLHVRYNAIAGGPQLEAAARANLASTLPTNGLRMLSLRTELSDAWHRMFFPAGDAPQALSFPIGRDQLPFYARSAANLRVTRLDLLIDSPHAGSLDIALAAPGEAAGAAQSVARDPIYGGAHHLTRTFAGPLPLLGDWTIQIKKGSATGFDSLTPADVRNAWLVVAFSTT